MPYTGDACRSAGEYEADDEHHDRQTFRRGDHFPPCPLSGEPVHWTLEIVREELQPRGMEID